MNFQKRDAAFTKEQAAYLLRAEYGDDSTIAQYMDYFAWPQTFSNTAGPFRGGVAGQAFTTYTLEAWADGEYALIFCQGKIVKLTCDWDGPGSVRV